MAGHGKNGIADIVFLIDATGSMSKCIDSLKNNLNTFIDALTTPTPNGGVPVKDWRAKVMGFRDYEDDGAANWLEDNPFVSDVTALKSQLSGLEAKGGGDEPECLLDALYLAATMPQTGQGAESEPWKWRYLRSAARVVIVFTDAPYKERMCLPDSGAGTLEELQPLCAANRIQLSIFAPDLPCYEILSHFNCSEFNPTNGEGLEELVSDPGTFQCILRQLAATVSVSSAPQIL